MASLGSSEFWPRDMPCGGTADWIPGDFPRGAWVSSHDNIPSLFIVSFIWSQRGYSSSCSWLFCSRWHTLVGTLMPSSVKPRSSWLKSGYSGPHRGHSDFVVLVSSLDWLSMNYWVDWMGVGSPPIEEDLRGHQKRNMAGLATGQPTWRRQSFQRPLAWVWKNQSL